MGIVKVPTVIIIFTLALSLLAESLVDLHPPIPLVSVGVSGSGDCDFLASCWDSNKNGGRRLN